MKGKDEKEVEGRSLMLSSPGWWQVARGSLSLLVFLAGFSSGSAVGFIHFIHQGYASSFQKGTAPLSLCWFPVWNNENPSPNLHPDTNISRAVLSHRNRT